MHGLAGPAASRSREVHADAVQRGFWCCLPSVHRGECASQGASAASCCGRIRPPGAPPSLLESAQATLWSVQCRFGAEDCMRRLCGTPPAGWKGCSIPVRVRCGPAEGRIRPCSGRRKGAGGPAHTKSGRGATPHSPAGRPHAPGHASIVHTGRYNEALCAKVNVSDPARRRTSHVPYSSRGSAARFHTRFDVQSTVQPNI